MMKLKNLFFCSCFDIVVLITRNLAFIGISFDVFARHVKVYTLIDLYRYTAAGKPFDANVIL